MTPPSERNARVISRSVVLILRLALDQESRLHHGELLDAEAVQQGRFTTVQGLLDSVAAWLERQSAISGASRGGKKGAMIAPRDPRESAN